MTVLFVETTRLFISNGCQNFLSLYPGGGAFEILILSWGGFLYATIVPEGGFCPFRVVSGGLSRGDGLDEIDKLIMYQT